MPRLRTIEHYFTEDMVTYYEPEDVESLTDAIFTLYSRSEQRRQRRQTARAHIPRRYGWERQGAELVIDVSSDWWRTERMSKLRFALDRLRKHRAQARARAAPLSG